MNFGEKIYTVIIFAVSLAVVVGVRGIVAADTQRRVGDGAGKKYFPKGITPFARIFQIIKNCPAEAIYLRKKNRFGEGQSLFIMLPIPEPAPDIHAA